MKRDTVWICLNAWKPEGGGEAISGAIFRSDDGGKAFAEIANGLQNRNNDNPLFAANCKAFDVSRTNPDILYVSDCAWNGCKIFRSTDGGKNWESVLERRASDGAEKTIDAAYFIGPAMTVLCIDPTDAEVVYAAGAEYIVRSTDVWRCVVV